MIIDMVKAICIHQTFGSKSVEDAQGSFKFHFEAGDTEAAWKLEDYLEEKDIKNASVNA